MGALSLSPPPALLPAGSPLAHCPLVPGISPGGQPMPTRVCVLTSSPSESILLSLCAPCMCLPFECFPCARQEPAVGFTEEGQTAPVCA